ncbi:MULTISPECIES: ATP-binding protein [Marinobacter]|uniref:ATP-binding protein n=1 Tax=Marinobacter TaxID=2742 RepID=UPI003B42EFFD|nr:ATP-binding protein [Marinobacter alkaliphilus]
MSSNIAEELDVGFDALRVCEAISKIGYEPYTAVMDIIDNSVAAESKAINVTLKLKEGKNLKSRNSVEYYQVIDDGRGMDHDEIKNAFMLGSQRNYKPNSLSKYGMGLKAAGLSLGTKISIISKKGGCVSKKYVFDLDEIEKRNKLAVIGYELDDKDQENVAEFLKGESGTMVEISGCENINQSSPGSTINKLRERVGVVYYSFLKDDHQPININLRVKPHGEDSDFESIKARDILFIDEASGNTGWDPETYDYSSPYLVLDAPWDAFKDKNGNALPPIQVSAVAFPQAVMGKDKSPLSPENKKRVNSYRVSRDNAGFFIYRNGRLIRWGDPLKGASGDPIVGKDDINLRIRFEISDQHDDILHVDVSKQRLEIDDEVLGGLEQIVKRALRTAKSIRYACQEKLKLRDVEGASFTSSLSDVAEDDPQELGKGTPDAESLNRKKKKHEEAKQELASEDVPSDTEGTESGSPGFIKIRYSENIPKRQLWKPYYDSVHGVYVYINKTHPFYQEFLSRFEDGTLERLTIESLIFSMALAENNVYYYQIDISDEKLDAAFNRLHKNIDSFLVDWTYENQGEE